MSGEARFLTAELPGTGGRIRARLEDFEVDERGSRAPSGRGDHAWMWLEKRGLSTPELQRRLGAALALPSAEVGVAGFKDALAVTRQWVSVPRDRVAALAGREPPGVRILAVHYDQHPLRPGDLRENRFRIVVRDVDPAAEALARARAILAVLERRGVPNFFGPQRFGVRGESAEVGRLLVLGADEAVLDVVLGRPSKRERDPRARAFRAAYEAGDVEGARRLVPRALTLERRLLDRLAATGSRAEAARALPGRDRRFYIGAYQALLFNRVLGRRLADIDRATAGDLLVDALGEVRAFRDPLCDQPAVTAGRLHPTAPLLGVDVPLAEGAPGAVEREVIAAEGIAEDVLRRRGRAAYPGQRRPLRFLPADVTVAALPREPALVLTFTLPKGCFATALLGEVTRTC